MPHRIMSYVMDKTTAAVSYATSGTVGLGGLLASEWVMVGAAIFFAAATFVVNWWYQHRRYHMDRERHTSDIDYHRARMERINDRSIEPYTGPDDRSG